MQMQSKFYLKVRFGQFINSDSLSSKFYLQISQTSEWGENLFRKCGYLIVPQIPANKDIKQQISSNKQQQKEKKYI